jgi:phage terminase large subunit-like protein
MKKLHGLFEEHLVVYENNPMTLWCLLNTGVKSLNKDGIESQQPVKVSSVKRIDGTVSALNAYTCLEKHEDDYERYIR